MTPLKQTLPTDRTSGETPAVPHAQMSGDQLNTHTDKVQQQAALKLLINSGAVANFSLSQNNGALKSSSARSWTIGSPVIDGHLPKGGLSHQAIHEIEATCPRHAPCATSFALGLIAQLRSTKPVIWCHTGMAVRENGHPYLAGLSRFGLDNNRLIFARLSRPDHLPFALEEALKTSGIAAVIGEGPRPNFTASRRLSFLTQQHNVPCLMVSDGGDTPLGSAAHTRWRVGPTLGPVDPSDPKGPGHMAWRLGLARARGGRPSAHLPSITPSALTQPDPSHHQTPLEWRLAWNDTTYSFTSLSLARGGAVHRGSPRPSTRQSHSLVGRTAGQAH